MTRSALIETPFAATLPMGRIALSLALRVVAWESRVQTRRAMLHLDGHLLRDIGLSADQVQAEAAKPFWRP